jgi:hypothetical protein
MRSADGDNAESATAGGQEKPILLLFKLPAGEVLEASVGTAPGGSVWFADWRLTSSR